MKHIHIDMIGGIAGDMFLAAALDAGLVEPGAVEAALSSLGFGAIEIERRRVRRGAISATHINFSGWDPADEQDHRHLSTILALLDDSGLDEAVTRRAKQMFETLGASESNVHDIPVDDVHFHECGALDSIFDFVSAAFVIEHNQPASWSAGPVPTGTGHVSTDHGLVPVPVPATADILAGFEVHAHPVEAELVTPTGATILHTLRQISGGVERPPATIAGTGYGAGTRQLEALSNVVRFLVMDTTEANLTAPAELARPESTADLPATPASRAAPAPNAAPGADLPAAPNLFGGQRYTGDVVSRLSCDIDDMNPELLGHVQHRLFDAGALDVVRESVVMKKARQGVRLTVLCRRSAAEAIAEVLFRQTSTFGIRLEAVERITLARQRHQVDIDAGTVHVKVGYRDGQPFKVAPEYDDCRRLADETGQPLIEIDQAARWAGRQWVNAHTKPTSDSDKK